MSEGIIRFREFVESLPRDVRDVLLLAEDKAVPKAARRWAVAALNYVLLNLDIVPDWVPVIGLCDDAAVLRVAMAAVLEQDLPDLPVERVTAMGRLGNEADAVRELLGPELYEALLEYARGLCDRAVQGRKPDGILRDDRSLAAWKRDVEAMLKAHRPDLRPLDDPAQVSRELLAYFRTKLGRKG